MNIKLILTLFKELKEYLRKYGDNSILNSYKILSRTIEVLDSEECDNKEGYIVHAYKLLYPGKGALSEFYIWENDAEKRKRLNESLDRIHNELWNNVKEYI